VGVAVVGAGKSLNRLLYKPLVLWSKTGRIGKTEWTKSVGRHIHIRGSLDPEKIHTGILQGADVLILDNIKWHVLFGSDLGRALAEGQDSVSWLRRNGERLTTQLTVPVIILNNKKCKTWGPNNKKYWAESLEWVRVRTCLFDTSKTINRDAPHVALPAPPPSSQPLPLSTSPPHVDATSLPPHVNATSPPPPTDASSSSLLQSSDASLSSSSSSTSPAPPSTSRSPRSSTVVRDRLRRTMAHRQLEPLVFNKDNIQRYGPDCYLITDWLTKNDADGQLAAWEKLDSQFRLMKHRGNHLARFKAFYCDPLAQSRTMYEYTSSELQSWEEHEWPPEGLQLRDAVRATLSEDINSLVANDYRHRKHKIGWHFDKPADIAHGTAIATASLGHARLFQLCPTAELQRWMDDTKARTKKMEENRDWGIQRKLPRVTPLAGVIDVVLPHGSLFVIGPETNEHYSHCIPVSEKKCGRRYGLTFRTIASRWLPDVEVVIRQPPKGETAWDVVHRPKETRKNGAVGQNGYAYRARIYLEPYTPRDPTRLTEEDIIAVRTSMPSRPRMRGRPSRTEKLAPQPEEAENASGEEKDNENSEEDGDEISEEEDDEISEEEDDEDSEEEDDEDSEEEDDEKSEAKEPEQPRSKRKSTEQTKGKSKKQRQAAESDEEDA
jgi:alkylated DNA repair dioxygenase AlkB